jgi:hypothetical protein
MKLSLKHGVRIHGLRPEMTLAAFIVSGVYEEYGFPCVITSAIDGKHSVGSFHYAGAALDFRTRDILDASKRAMLTEEVRNRLGPDFDVVAEVDHMHVESQPKQPYGAA